MGEIVNDEFWKKAILEHTRGGNGFKSGLLPLNSSNPNVNETVEEQEPLYPAEVLNPSLRALVPSISNLKELFGAYDEKAKDYTKQLEDLGRLQNNPDLLQSYMTQNNLNEEQARNALSREQNTLQEQLNAATEGRTNAHNSADKLRALMREYGMSDEQAQFFGADKTLDDVNETLAVNDFRAVNDLLYGGKYQLSADEYFNDRYNQYRRSGYGVDDAEQLASEDSARYSAERRAAHSQALNLYGRSGNMLNDVGMSILGRMAQDDPTVATLNLNSYALPKNEYANAFDWSKLQFNDAAQNERLITQLLNQLGIAELNANNSRDVATMREDRADARNTANIQSREAIAASRQSLLRELAANAQATRIALAQYSANNRNSSGNGRNSNDFKNIMKSLEDQIRNLEKLRDTYDETSEEYNQYQGQVRDLREKVQQYMANPNLLIPLEFDTDDNESVIDFISDAQNLGWGESQIREQLKEAGFDSNTIRHLLDRAT